jgi:hypothetical protein
MDRESQEARPAQAQAACDLIGTKGQSKYGEAKKAVHKGERRQCFIF